ncbi:uncharacterized protein LOC133183449 [Saccostrea echinata]|uniref:uncharacterized protein LOC133183449 n=1 Tax=Saccostrea echinata TaxID=191078 RepID=UPI002A83CE8A|nr:uncharacterized protein LOC133183449 [Saccostrea echinata]
MSSNSPAQFVPSTPRFRLYTTEDACANSSPAAVVPSMGQSLDRTTDSSDAAVPRTPVAEPTPTRTPHNHRFSAVPQTPVSRYANYKLENLSDQQVPSTPKRNQNPTFSTHSVATATNIRRAERLHGPRRKPRRILPSSMEQDSRTINFFSGENIFSY